MNRLYISLLLLNTIWFFSCSDKKQLQSVEFTYFSNTKPDDNNLNNWILEDIKLDSVPGISLDRAINDELITPPKNPIIIAVIDTEIDINHESLKRNIWQNKKEIPGNGKDDDANGYIDDINGWNFIGNAKGENIIYPNNESLRIIRAYKKDSLNGLVNKELYKKALKKYEEAKESAQSDMDYVNFLTDTYPKSKKALLKFFPKEDYTTDQLDSLYDIYKEKDEELAKLIYYMSDYIKYDLSKEWIDDLRKTVEGDLNKSLNPDYFDRDILGDNPDDINDISYGTPIVNGHIGELYHGTEVASIIAAQTDSLKGVCENCLIMPVSISSNGNEHDKDIALGIKYAVDNGAKVINMSFGKELSLHKQWVLDAIKYAEDNNVLIVSSAGNSRLNLSEITDYYPNDNLNDETEVSNNYILVGATTNTIDPDLLAYFSNYGQHDVDVFAPGHLIKAAIPNNKYKEDSGTSLSSAVVSGIAGIIFSQYPDLSAAQVKRIIMNSGVEYNIDVSVPSKDNPKRLLPFKQLSKSGKIVNVYNALLMAKSLSDDN
ncbi:S8 family serine peptidase [Galbibacter sp. EGI 63066]|uniref:S8 family serine peptidase n=1 Tax=Galbibacter sp. EGI 63066 TaxID=2993559 RepID=UPI0022495219|nr:S8 family serine peptidase [Galbibacter sp. EGI 63066]MCX2678896.1 S8 family serine peptidase [Galbibacter sp. EGI 63066]